LYSPSSKWALAHKDFGTQGEGLIYVGRPLLWLVGLGLLAIAVRRLGKAMPYALLVAPVLFLTLGPRADIGRFRPYRFLFDHLPFLALQRVPERLMALTALVLVFLAMTALETVGQTLVVMANWAQRPPSFKKAALRIAAALTVVMTMLLIATYRVSDNVLQSD